MSNISIILADAEYLIRVGLTHILHKNTDFEVVGTVVNASALLEMMETQKADVVVMDYNQPGNFSTQVIQDLKKAYPETGILVISADNEKDSIYKVLEYGVTSFLTKTCDEKEIIEGVYAAAKKQRYFCKKVMDYVFERSFSPATEDCAPLPLTVREIEVVQLTAKGLIAKEIADKLNLSTHTIYTHRKNIMRKLKINTASELILYAVNNGLVR